MRVVKLVRTVMRHAQGVRRPRLVMTAMLVTALVSGAANTGLLAVVNAILANAVLLGPYGVGNVALFATLAVGLPLTRYVSEVLLVHLTSQAMHDLRIVTLDRVIAAPLAAIEKLGPHRVLATVTDDAPAMVGALTNLPLLCMHASVLLTSMVYVAFLSPALFVALAVALLVGTSLYGFMVMSPVRGHQRAARESWSDVMRGFESLLAATKELKLDRSLRDGFLNGELRCSITAMRDHGTRWNLLSKAAKSIGHAIFFVVLGVVVFVAPVLGATTVTLTGFVVALLYMMTPIEVLLNALPGLARAEVAADHVNRLAEELDAVEPERLTSAGDAIASPDCIELEGVTHTYRDESGNATFEVGPIDLSWRRGEVIFVVGGNGSGKTTMMKLLAGLYRPEAGVVRVDGRLVEDGDRDAYRQSFAAIFSDFHLFERLYGGGRDPVAAAHVLDYVELSDKIRIDDGARLSTTKLSHGQRKRVAMAVALLQDRPFYMFDEWAADQDPSYRDVFYRELLPELKRRGAGVLAITHDDHYFDAADRIVVLDKGRVLDGKDKLPWMATRTSRSLSITRSSTPSGRWSETTR